MFAYMCACVHASMYVCVFTAACNSYTVLQSSSGTLFSYAHW